MGKRAKQIEKRITGNKRAIEEHREKIKKYGATNPYLNSYWEKEIESMSNKVKEDETRLKKK